LVRRRTFVINSRPGDLEGTYGGPVILAIIPFTILPRPTPDRDQGPGTSPVLTVAALVMIAIWGFRRRDVLS